MAVQHLLHHVEIGVRHGLSAVKRLVNGFNFRTIAKRDADLVQQWLLQAGSTKFLITQLKNSGEDDFSIPSQLHTKDKYTANWNDYLVDKRLVTRNELIDSVFNVALEVKDVERCVKRVSQQGAQVLRPPSRFADTNGHVTYATVRSCVGNVIHTLINSQNYKGVFLPEFVPVNSEPTSVITTKPLFDHVDHITLACHKGSSLDIIKWYEDAFGMKRFFLNSEEDTEGGFVVQTKNIGMRLFAMNYWKCSEMGLEMPPVENTSESLKLTIAEALPGDGPNQVETFLQEHLGAGIQHIGLHTDSILDTVHQFYLNGVEFLNPPPTYYTKLGKLSEISLVGENAKLLQQRGVLLDAEADAGNTSSSVDEYRYLMQVFTKTLFDRNTFFLELIQRNGASGFGAGNISALWTAVDAYFQSQEQNHQHSAIKHSGT
ncbi:4-hydroxyphenylpyruvate dioxygenase-like protein [Tubulanus polymorphus]|uniref:4-hydroxyphenylpyruvate dioxygenase-like protein n=1 Tax=Tubulanus polymorphus TaxID=672921 RepID=UPI003DA4C65F